MFALVDGSVIEFTIPEVERMLKSFDAEKDPHFYKQITKILEKAKQRRNEMLNIERG